MYVPNADLSIVIVLIVSVRVSIDRRVRDFQLTDDGHQMESPFIHGIMQQVRKVSNSASLRAQQKFGGSAQKMQPDSLASCSIRVCVCCLVEFSANLP